MRSTLVGVVDEEGSEGSMVIIGVLMKGRERSWLGPGPFQFLRYPSRRSQRTRRVGWE